MTCTGCHNLDARAGECMQLQHMVVCCSVAFEMHVEGQVRKCGVCDGYARAPAAPLQVADCGYQASPYCPLTDQEKGRLIAKQTVAVQKELF